MDTSKNSGLLLIQVANADHCFVTWNYTSIREVSYSEWKLHFPIQRTQREVFTNSEKGWGTQALSVS